MTDESEPDAASTEEPDGNSDPPDASDGDERPASSSEVPERATTSAGSTREPAADGETVREGATGGERTRGGGASVEPDDGTASESGSAGGAGSAPGSGVGADSSATGDASTLAEDEVRDPGSIDRAELTVERRSLHPRIRLIWMARAVVFAAVAGGLAAVTAFTFEFGPLLPAGVTVVLLGLGVPFAHLRYRAWSYEVREDALYLERGVITRVRTVVPLVRIQHVDTSRGPIARATGLATTIVYTAGSRGADVAIPGLAADRADDLQRRLKRLAIASEADTSV